MVSVLLVFSSSCCPCCCVVGLSLPWILTPLCLTSLWCCSADTWSPAIQGEEGLGRVLGVVWIVRIGVGIREHSLSFISS